MSQKKIKELKKLVEPKNKDNNDLADIGIRKIIKDNWKFLFFLLLGVVVLYFNSLKGDFVSDDYATIPQNPQILSVSNALSFTGPINNLYKTLIALIFGISSPIPYHVGNLILYLLVCLSAFVFLRLFFNDFVSRVAMVVFAVLPTHVEAVSWISGEPYLITSLFVLFGLINFILFLKKKNKKYLIFFLLMIISIWFNDKIRGFSIVLIFGLILVSFREKFKVKVNLGTVFFGILFFVGILLLVAWPLIKERVASVNSGVNVSDSIFYNPFFQYPTAIPKYLQLLLFPTDLTLYHTMYISPMWFNWLVFLFYLVTVAWFYFKDKKIFFALAFIFVATAPSMAPVKVSWLVAERYTFLGSLGISLLMALLVDRYWEKRKYIVVGLLSAFVAAYGVRTFLRNIDWQTNHKLWVNTCQVSPNSHNAWNNIGDDYDKLGQYENAIKGFGMSYGVKQNYADAYHNQGNIFYKIGRLDLARQSYEQTLVYNPNLYQTYMTLIQLDLMEKRKEDLLRHTSQLNQVKPNDLQVAYMTATAYAQIGMIDEAKKISEVMYKQFPNITEIKNLYETLKSIESSKSAIVK